MKQLLSATWSILVALLGVYTIFFLPYILVTGQANKVDLVAAAAFVAVGCLDLTTTHLNKLSDLIRG